MKARFGLLLLLVLVPGFVCCGVLVVAVSALAVRVLAGVP